MSFEEKIIRFADADTFDIKYLFDTLKNLLVMLSILLLSIKLKETPYSVPLAIFALFGVSILVGQFFLKISRIQDKILNIMIIALLMSIYICVLFGFWDNIYETIIKYGEGFFDQIKK